MNEIIYKVRPPVSNAELNPLFAVSWPRHEEWDFSPVHERSLLWVCAYAGSRLIGYVNVAWDGAQHGFILDTTVHPDFRRRGIGVEIVKTAIEAARAYDLDWLHVDYDPSLEAFYVKCGFRPSAAAVLRMK